MRVAGEEYILKLLEGQGQGADSDLIAFSFGDFACVTLSYDVKEIATVQNVKPVPGVKPWLVGCMKHGMDLIPLLDLSHFVKAGALSLKGNPECLVVGQKGSDPVGVLVTNVDRFYSVHDLKMSRDPVKIPKGIAPFVRGFCKSGNDNLIFVDLISVIKSPQFINMEL